MGTQPKVMIVEDDPRIAEVIAAYLGNAGLATTVIDRGDTVLPALQAAPPALLVLDLMLPGLDGVSLCKAVRQQYALPIIMVTAKVEEIDRLLGFEVGADDYLCKPFSPRELVARVLALLRRSGQLASLPQSITFVDDPAQQRIRCQGQPLPLTPQEYRLFSVLLGAPGRIFSRAKLLELAYADSGDVFDRAVDSHIKNLRKKLVPYLGERVAIHSVYGIGYRFELA